MNCDKEYPKGYTILDNRISFKKLSLKELGLYALLEMLPPNFEITVSGLTAILKDGKKSINTAIDQSKKDGILTVERINKENGQFEYKYKTQIPP